ncbi:tyrosine-type recombinase/integrase [Actinomadura fibrosa]|uniref:Tyrosine-type recombinase/integrase n=1 Tax=Actinomadura fibrosa TaxID=111802 RepID=A0ABW2Y0Q7_9ACTN|nr:tyrosine-type recombinase/integrase [Actinomadura fibrosa]
MDAQHVAEVDGVVPSSGDASMAPEAGEVPPVAAALSGVVVPAHRPPAPSVPGEAGDEAQREADLSLSAGAAERIERALAVSSRTAYAKHWRGFARWCWLTGRTPMPATAQTLATYLDHLSRTPTGRGTPIAPGTLSNVLGALQAVHKAAGQVADVRLARSVLKDYRRERAAAGHRTRKSLPITTDVLRTLVEATLDAVAAPDTAPPDARRITPLRALHTQVTLVLGLALAARSSEIADLDIADVAFPAPGRMIVTIGSSKTDQEGRGSDQSIQHGAHVETCPVRLTQAWVDTLAAHGITDGPLIRGLDRHGRLAGTPGYAGRLPADGVPRITNNALNALVRTAVARANATAVARGRTAPLADPGQWSWHGVRAGLATSGGEANLPPTTIAERGRWKSLIMVMQYWRDGAAWRRQIEAEIGL